MKSPQQVFTLTPELDQAIEEWFYTRRCRSRSEAVRQMLACGFEISSQKEGLKNG